MEPDIQRHTRGKLLLEADAIQQAVRRIAGQIDRDYEGKDPILVCVLTGAFLFFSDLVRQLTIEHQVDFIRLSAYGYSTSPGKPAWLMGPSLSIRNRHVLVVDDILDTGETASCIETSLRMLQPQSIQFVVLLSKMSRRRRSVLCPYVGFDIDDHFVYGYGLDLEERQRSLTSIYHV